MREYRSIFVSDVHLGTPDCQADYLLDFLRGTRSRQLYLVGDIVDLESLHRRAYWPTSHARVVAEILAIAARGTDVIYVPGNHDCALRGLAGAQFSGLRVQRFATHLAADGRRYRVSHGDEFDPQHHGRRWLEWIGEHSHRGLRWCNRSINRARRRFGLPYLPLSIATKSRIAAAMAFILDFEARAVSTLAIDDFDGQICGHIHYGNIRRIGGALYLNCGDWVEHCTALVEDGEGAMRLLHWSECRSELASSALREPVRTLPGPTAFASLSPERVALSRANAKLVA
jgi:UDP-2,3-diacylglucosamine pyrophosphatase LpxH